MLGGWLGGVSQAGPKLWCARLVPCAGGEGTLEGWLSAAGHEVFEVRQRGPGAEFLVYGSRQEVCRLRELAGGAPQAVEHVECSEVRDDWKLGWLEHLEPAQLTPTVRVVPEGLPAAAGDLVLRRAMAFGYGEHATTRLAAGWLEQTLRKRGVDQGRSQVLDVGCGTGVLSLLAARLGACAVGVDIEPEAVASAQENAARNGLESRCRFILGGPERVAAGSQFEVLVVNIEAAALCALAPAVAALRTERAAVGVAGLLAEQACAVQAAYASVGVRLEPQAQEGPWQLLSCHGG